MGLAGDISKLEELRDNLRTLAEVPSRASKEVADNIHALITHQFATSQDPYGEPWAPLAKATLDKGRTEPALYDTGSMYRSLDVTPMRGAGVSITIDPPAPFHQFGTKDMPARPIIPGEDGLPESWKETIKDAVDNAVKKAVQ